MMLCLGSTFTGVVMIAPAGNPYAKNMTLEETKEFWGTLPRTQKNMFRLARYFPSLLPNFLKKTVKKINGNMRSIKKIVSEKVQYPTLLGMNCLLTAGHEFAHVFTYFAWCKSIFIESPRIYMFRFFQSR
jgi:hypothetical protein